MPMPMQGPAPAPAPAMTPPRDFTDHGPCVEEIAREFATQDAVSSEALIEMLATQAIRQWRLDDATFWQRVKFQARMIRARQGAWSSDEH